MLITCKYVCPSIFIPWNAALGRVLVEMPVFTRIFWNCFLCFLGCPCEPRSYIFVRSHQDQPRHSPPNSPLIWQLKGHQGSAYHPHPSPLLPWPSSSGSRSPSLWLHSPITYSCLQENGREGAPGDGQLTMPGGQRQPETQPRLMHSRS